MIKFEQMSGEMKEMLADDIFSSRLKLLIIMAKAYLIGCPIGKYRKQAIIENAHNVFYRSIQLVNEFVSWENYRLDAQVDVISKGGASTVHFFHQRVQLLSVMVKAMVEDYLIGKYRKRSLKENLDKICETLIFDFQMKDVNFLKVA